MNARTVLPLLLLSLAIAGCGSSGSSPSPTPSTAIAIKSYTDPNFGFRFSYPTAWQAPRQGSSSAATGPNNYFVHLTLPKQVAGVEVEVSGQVTPFPPITDGEKRKDPRGPDIFTYYHARVSGLPALRVLRSYKGQVDEVATFVNLGHREYTVRMVTISPPFPTQVMAGYNVITRTLKLPKS